jgi:hydantoinase/carbamoylase family amidase
VRFGSTLLGSRAIAGNFNFDLLDQTDQAGISMRQALRDYGLDPSRVAMAAHEPSNVLAYVEVHIEQGPVLLNKSLPVGIVTAIAGASRFQIEVTGLAGHAGTVPMSLRYDAAAAAAEAVLFIEQRCQSVENLVGTVGQFTIPNGAVNVVPGSAEFSIDIRSGDDAVRRDAVNDVLAECQAIGQRRKVQFEITPRHDASAAVCAPRLMQQFEAAVQRSGLAPYSLPSGAGHDAMAFTDFCDIAMLFVRCGNGGISHHPDEQLSAEDAELGALVLLDFIRHFES